MPRDNSPHLHERKYSPILLDIKFTYAILLLGGNPGMHCTWILKKPRKGFFGFQPKLSIPLYRFAPSIYAKLFSCFFIYLLYSIFRIIPYFNVWTSDVREFRNLNIWDIGCLSTSDVLIIIVILRCCRRISVRFFTSLRMTVFLNSFCHSASPPSRGQARCGIHLFSGFPLARE